MNNYFRLLFGDIKSVLNVTLNQTKDGYLTLSDFSIDFDIPKIMVCIQNYLFNFVHPHEALPLSKKNKADVEMECKMFTVFMIMKLVLFN